jgi:hypothetical protein
MGVQRTLQPRSRVMAKIVQFKHQSTERCQMYNALYMYSNKHTNLFQDFKRYLVCDFIFAFHKLKIQNSGTIVLFYLQKLPSPPAESIGCPQSKPGNKRTKL